MPAHIVQNTKTQLTLKIARLELSRREHSDLRNGRKGEMITPESDAFVICDLSRCLNDIACIINKFLSPKETKIVYVAS